MSKSNKVIHIEHVEDLVFDGYVEYSTAYRTLSDIRWKLVEVDDSAHVTIKFDGAPAIVFGTNPDNGKFFVGTKSVFNEDPKICYTEEDINNYYASLPGLAGVLSLSLRLLPYCMKTKTGVYQGDFMFDRKSIDFTDDDRFAAYFTPNVITYVVEPVTNLYADVCKAHMGIVVHTEYSGNRLADSEAEPIRNFSEHFESNGFVCVIDPSIHVSSVMQDLEDLDFSDTLDLLDACRGKINWTYIRPHREYLRMYVNSCIREETDPGIDGYVDWLVARSLKEASKLKSAKGKASKLKMYASLLEDVGMAPESFSAAFFSHSAMAGAKMILIKVLDRNVPFKHFIGFSESGSEGYVAQDVGNQQLVKLVNRKEFSKANFAKNG